MQPFSKVDWDKGDKDGLVTVGSHNLYLSVSGPGRKPGDPIVVLMQGIGSTVDEWIAVRKLVVPFARWLNYDRSGMGRSEGPNQTPPSISAASVAAELDTLLRNASIEPPFIIVAHSWGGYTSREFLELRPNDVVGMVFVDCNTERLFDSGAWGWDVFGPVLGNQDYVETTGLAMSHVLSEEEWKAVRDQQANPRHRPTEAAELQAVPNNRRALAHKNQLEKLLLKDYPVSVIIADTPKDFQKMYDFGVAVGNGTEQERALFRKCLDRWHEMNEDWQRDLLRLSRLSRSVLLHCSHNVQLLQPQSIVQEIQWAMDSWR
ncbi:alpha/beta-hydrolase [Penicillium cosmopolitanum]|uniref:Alpha/beta-hydrolase n=1 Tax=Penicillium cosmopolitanum TaxID=1131564 RepID=A0A9X0BCB6_9EURO|nr:alpha/beta-hydrolase [Penicillium cosmopolitanum]KAJ5404458.1 alpha/beta-hydrolase [Penicillium cosmopolitanum]